VPPVNSGMKRPGKPVASAAFALQPVQWPASTSAGLASCSAATVAGMRASHGGLTRCRPPATVCTASQTSRRMNNILIKITMVFFCKMIFLFFFQLYSILYDMLDR